MRKISKEEVQESFDKIRELKLKEPNISVDLGEITATIKCVIDSTKHMIDQNVM